MRWCWNDAHLHIPLTVACYPQVMLPIRHSSLFRSRWMALLWAGGICWSAISFVGTSAPGDDDAKSGNVSEGDRAADLNQVQALVGKLEH